jgi:hypothetical protein
MSSDIFLQDFSAELPDRSAKVDPILTALLDSSGTRITTSDGEADVYGLADSPMNGLMFNHVEGDAAWDVIYEIALAAKWVVMPVGCAVCVPSEEIVDSIPEELREMGFELVRSGSDILRLVRSS